MFFRDDVFLRKISWEYILEQNICELPVNSFELAARNGHYVMTYAKYSMLTGIPKSRLVDEYDDSAFVLWSKKFKGFVICFNEKQSSIVTRWTIMHENSHVILEQVTPDSPPLTLIRREERPHEEIQADGITRRVLCPSIVLHDCGAIETPDIMKLCGVSREAAKHRSDYMKKLEARGKYRTDPLEREVEKQFMPFIVAYNNGKYSCEFSQEIAA